VPISLAASIAEPVRGPSTADLQPASTKINKINMYIDIIEIELYIVDVKSTADVDS